METEFDLATSLNIAQMLPDRLQERVELMRAYADRAADELLGELNGHLVFRAQGIANELATAAGFPEGPDENTPNPTWFALQEKCEDHGDVRLGVAEALSEIADCIDDYQAVGDLIVQSFERRWVDLPEIVTRLAREVLPQSAAA